METLVYYNGKYSTFNEALIPLSDRSVFFGDAVYDVILGRSNIGLFQAERHIERLLGNAEFMGFEIKTDLYSLIREIAGYADTEYYSVYIQLSRRGGERNHISNTPKSTNFLIVLSEAFLPDISTPVSAVTCEDKRYSFCNIKTTNLLPAVLASQMAHNSGADETIFIRDGIVTEGAKSNVFIINDNFLITHPKDSCILPGITRENLIRSAELFGLKIKEEKFTKSDLFSADEILVTSTTKFARRVSSLDGFDVGMKAQEIYTNLAMDLQKEFKQP